MRRTNQTRRLILPGIAAVALALGYSSNLNVVTATNQKSAALVRPSNILDDLRRQAKRQPKITARELAAYANKKREEKGFDYEFDVCDVIDPNLLERISSGTPATLEYSHKMKRSAGGEINLRFVTENPANAACGECFSSIPALQVTKQEMLIVSGSRRYKLKRPPTFTLDEAELMDQSMTKVLRTWQLPYEAIPIGISADGAKLYLAFYYPELDELALELTEDGRAQFKARSDVGLQSEGEWIDNHPQDPKNAYLSFKRFQAGGQTHVVRFSAPCT